MTPSNPRQERAGERAAMVATQIAARGITEPAVLGAMRAAPRHAFVPPSLQRQAYRDGPLPVGSGQTISQPYVVAAMTALSGARAGSRVLEVGTGSGYQTAVLCELGAEVYSVEIVPDLAARAREALESLGYQNLHLRVSDGYRGWPEAAPFDAIIVTAAPPAIPRPLVEQLRVAGKMVIPVGGAGFQGQALEVVTRTEAGIEEREVFPVRFVPMTGEAQTRGTPD